MGIVAFSAEAYAKLQSKLFPPGKLWNLAEDGFIYKVLLSAGDELERVSARVVDLIREADSETTVELLEEFEIELELPSTGTDSERQDRIVAREVEESRFRPADVKAVLAPYLDLDVGDIEVIETSRATAIATGNDRAIYLFFVYRDPTLPGTADIDAAQAELDSTPHSHTKGVVIESDDAKFDEATTLYDRDIYGA